MRRTLTLLTVGLSAALVAALVMVAIPAQGAPNGGGPGDPLLLSRVNQAGPMTVLKTNGGFRILAKNPKRPPLMIYSPDSIPPLDVSSTAKVENLNVDLLDGLDSSAFSPAAHLHDDRYYTETESDARYLGKTAKAADADLLDGLDSSAFLGTTAKAADANLLDGLDSTAYVKGTDLVLPIAAYEGGIQYDEANSWEAVVRSVSLTPPTAGTVLVNSTVVAAEETAGAGVACSITDAETMNWDYEQYWTSGGFGSSAIGQLAGTRGFPVTGDTSFTANLVCVRVGGTEGGSTLLYDSSLTAIFIPNP